MRLNSAELAHLLECMRRVHGPGYAPGSAGRLQAKLSMMLEASQQMMERCEPIPMPPEGGQVRS